jgi:hypothetical protein
VTKKDRLISLDEIALQTPKNAVAPKAFVFGDALARGGAVHD